MDNFSELKNMIISHVYGNNHEYKDLLKKYIMYLNFISTNIQMYKIDNKIDNKIDDKISGEMSGEINDSYSLYEYLYPLIITQLEQILSKTSEKDNDIHYFQLGGSSINYILKKFTKLYDIPDLEIIQTKDIDIRSMILYKNNTVNDRERCHNYNKFVGNQLLLYLRDLLPQFKFEFVIQEFDPTICNVMRLIVNAPFDTFSLIDFGVQYDDTKPLDVVERAYIIFNDINDFYYSMINNQKTDTKKNIIISGLGFEILSAFYLLKHYQDKDLLITNTINTIYKDFDTYVKTFWGNIYFDPNDESFKNTYYGHKEYYNHILTYTNQKIKKYNKKIDNMFKLISFIEDIDEIHTINIDFNKFNQIKN